MFFVPQKLCTNKTTRRVSGTMVMLVVQGLRQAHSCDPKAGSSAGAVCPMHIGSQAQAERHASPEQGHADTPTPLPALQSAVSLSTPTAKVLLVSVRTSCQPEQIADCVPTMRQPVRDRRQQGRETPVLLLGLLDRNQTKSRKNMRRLRAVVYPLNQRQDAAPRQGQVLLSRVLPRPPLGQQSPSKTGV